MVFGLLVLVFGLLLYSASVSSIAFGSANESGAGEFSDTGTGGNMTDWNMTGRNVTNEMGNMTDGPISLDEL
jgi:hypothetical protein